MTKIKKIEHSEETRISLLELSIQHINETLLRLEKRFDKIDSKFDKVDSRLESIDNKIDSNFKWLLSFVLSGLGLMISGFAGIFAIMAHGFKWF